MIILDTNVLSALMQQTPNQQVIAWLDRQPASSIWTTSVTVLEIRYGLEIMAAGRKRTLLLQAFEALLEKMGRRIVSFDADAAMQTAELMASRRRKGTPADLRDSMIAGIVLARRAGLATRNTSHFDDIPAQLMNPWAP